VARACEGEQRRLGALRRAAADGLTAVPIASDGACLFRAVCHSNTGSDVDHQLLRASAVDYMRAHSIDFTDFLTDDSDPDEHLPFDAYLAKISRDDQEVGEFVISAIANVLRRQISVYFNDGPPRAYFPSTEDEVQGQTINILFQDSMLMNSGHYLALVSASSVAHPMAGN
jgi:hypothetical protein